MPDELREMIRVQMGQERLILYITNDEFYALFSIMEPFNTLK